jgi:hypothetical protein
MFKCIFTSTTTILASLPECKEYATSLGFSWLENWAYYMPIEKVLAFAEGQLPERERAYVEDTFALPNAHSRPAVWPCSGNLDWEWLPFILP